ATPSSESSSERLIVLAHKGSRGVRITNETDSTWTGCNVDLLGDYRAVIDNLNPRQSVELYYTDFRHGGTSMNEGDGFQRALQSMTVNCNGIGGRQDARIY